MSAGRGGLSAARVVSLSLSRFRSHARFERSFDGRPVAIHGPNGAGKTNILEAVSLLSPGRGLRGASAEEIAGRPDPIGWRLGAALACADGETRAIRIAVDLRNGTRRSVEIDGAATSSTALGALARVIWLTPAMDRLWTDAAAERRRFLDRTALAFAPSHGERSIAYERAMRERNRLLKEDRREPAWFAALERTMAEAAIDIRAARIDAVTRIAAAQASGESAFPKAALGLASAFDDAAAALDSEAIAARLASGRARDAAAGRTLFGPHRTDLTAVYVEKGVEARLCSTGEQKALLVSIILATARALARDIGEAPLILLDEIAAHFDPDRRAALFDEICALGAQAWMTGAEAGLFDDFGDRAERLALPVDG